MGPLGVSLRNLIIDAWRGDFLKPHGFVELSTPIITPRRLLEASGHVENFKDPMTECTQCKRRFRADQLVKEQTGIETEGLTLGELGRLQAGKNVRCPECGGTLTTPEHFVTMFKTSIGPYGEDPAYGRPEAAQGIFVNFKRVLEVMRERFPIGIAQVGTVLRNEISPRQGPIRLREFTILDFELFFNPQEPECPFLSEVANEELRIVTESSRKAGNEEPIAVSARESLERKIIKTPWTAYFMALSKRFLNQLGISSEKQRFFEKLPGERAHYSAQTLDHEVRLDRWGWVEVAGFAYRTDYDLRRHMEATGVDMQVFKAYDRPVERTTTTVRPLHDMIRKTFGNEAAKIMELVANQNLEQLLHERKTGFIHIQGYQIPLECFETREEKVKDSGTRFIPHVVEPSFGVERLVYATLEHNLFMREDRLVLSLPFRLAPTQVSVFPLVTKDNLDQRAQQIHKLLLKSGFRADYDEAGSIGRRYARSDEAGVPLAVTVDYDTLRDNTVTLRDRDSWRQIRSTIDRLEPTILEIAAHGFPQKI